MKERRYRHRTKVLGIPVVGYNHPILPSVEMKKWQFVENLLLAAMQGVDSCLFHEGNIAIEKNENGSYDAVMSSSSKGKSLTGVAGGRYFEYRGRVEWNNLSDGAKHLLYIVSNQRTHDDPRRVRAVATKYRIPTSSVLVATVDLSGETPKVDMQPEGKASRKMIESHVGLSENPHGKMILQDELAVKRIAVIESIEVDDKGPLNKQGLREASDLGWKIYRVKTNGEEGVVVEADGFVKMAQVSFEENPNNKNSLWVGYHGIDPKADAPNKFIVYSASSGVQVRVAAFCER